jgi:hypothetical protein
MSRVLTRVTSNLPHRFGRFGRCEIARAVLLAGGRPTYLYTIAQPVDLATSPGNIDVDLATSPGLAVSCWLAGSARVHSPGLALLAYIRLNALVVLEHSLS